MNVGDKQRLGRLAYAEYVRRFDDPSATRQMREALFPDWENLHPATQDAWGCAAVAVADAVRNDVEREARAKFAEKLALTLR